MEVYICTVIKTLSLVTVIRLKLQFYFYFDFYNIFSLTTVLSLHLLFFFYVQADPRLTLYYKGNL